MKNFKRYLAAFTAAVVTVTSLPAANMPVQAANVTADRIASADTTVVLHPEKASPFNDTDNDGFGEFQGWGTSLCWWANRLGYSEKLTADAAKVFFSDEGLDLNIGRYNIGGGDNVGEEVTVEKVVANEKAQFFDLETEGKKPEYSGTEMKVSDMTKLSNAVYTQTDADFGFNKGDKVGSFKYIGWINKLGDSAGKGDNLHYTVDVPEAGKYTVKVIATLEIGSGDSLSRDIAIRINEGTEEEIDYVVGTDQLNKNEICAAASNQHLYMATISDISLHAGENKINVAGQKDWTLDFVKMAVIKSSELGVVPEEPAGSEFRHAPHITRSDSAVPGYAKDVTKIKITEEKDEEYWTSHFARADFDCGFAWNYDWTADQNQLNILKAAKAASGKDFIAEAFSNSPPYFMTYSGCSSGNVDANKDNLRKDSYKAFAKYMADVIVHWAEEGLVDFQSVDPMNEPYTNYWGAYSYKQEGCHFDQGTSESTIFEELYDEMNALAEKSDNEDVKRVVSSIIYCGTDETSIDTSISSYNKLSDKAKGIIGRIDTHTYSGSNRAGLSALAEQEGKNLWMSEVDGAYQAGQNAGNMSAGLGISQAIMKDIKGLRCTAWIMWNAVDTNVDRTNAADADEMQDLYTKKNDKGEILYKPNIGYWGIALGNHNDEKIVLTKKYYAMGQFSRYIRPGFCVIESTGDSLAAYDPHKKEAVIVVNNTKASDQTCSFDLTNFTGMSDKITAIRTSGVVVDTNAAFDEAKLIEGENWADVTKIDDIKADANKQTFTATLKANSVTTYIIHDVEYSYNKAAFYTPEVEKIKIKADNVSGSAAWNNGTVNTFDKAVDGNTETFFDGVADGYVQIDLEDTYKIEGFGYAPRKSFGSRCTGTFYGSNDEENWDKLYTITTTPSEGVITKAYSNDFFQTGSYRYIKYAVSGDDLCNIAEIEVYRTVVDQDYLKGSVNKYELKTSGKEFEKDSQAAYDAALKEAKELIGKEGVTAQQIDEAVNKLQKAYEALSSFADASEAEEIFKEIETNAVDTTVAGAAEYEAAIKEAKEIIAKEKATQSEVDAATAKLKAAKETYEAGVKAEQEVLAKAEEAMKAAEEAVASNDLNKSKAAIEAAKAAFSALTDAQKAKLSDEVKAGFAQAQSTYAAAVKAAEAAKKASEIKPAAVGTMIAGSYVVTNANASAPEVAYKQNPDKNAKKVAIPATVTEKGITYKVTSIADNAFKGNKKLSSVTIPAGVTSIGKNVFAGCVALKKITIPANVTDIGAKAFSGDKNLKKITIQSAVLKKVGSGAFKNIHKKATIKVPKKKKKAYQKLLKKKGQAATVKIK